MIEWIYTRHRQRILGSLRHVRRQLRADIRQPELDRLRSELADLRANRAQLWLQHLQELEQRASQRGNAQVLEMDHMADRADRHRRKNFEAWQAWHEKTHDTQAMVHVRDRHQEIVATLRKALEIMADGDRLHLIAEEDRQSHVDDGRYTHDRVSSAGRRMADLAMELAAITYTIANGPPATLSCICGRCKRILMRHPAYAGYPTCTQCCRLQPGDALGMHSSFWGRHTFGSTYKGLLEEDLQEDLLKRQQGLSDDETPKPAPNKYARRKAPHG